MITSKTNNIRVNGKGLVPVEQITKIDGTKILVPKTKHDYSRNRKLGQRGTKHLVRVPPIMTTGGVVGQVTRLGRSEV